MKHKIESDPRRTSPEPDATQSTMASPRKAIQPSTIRFLGLLKPSNSDPNPFELDESEVVWSPDYTDLHSYSPPAASSPPTSQRRYHHPHHHHQFRSGKSGLSAALFDDHHSLVRRKSALNPSISAASVARAAPHVPLLRSESSNGLAAPKFLQSAPMNVPVWPKKAGERGVDGLRHFDEQDEDEAEEEMVPPHEIVARSQVMTFSVFEGVGRTLKGRDLRRVRNAVFQKTGFID